MASPELSHNIVASATGAAGAVPPGNSMGETATASGIVNGMIGTFSGVAAKNKIQNGGLMSRLTSAKKAPSLISRIGTSAKTMSPAAVMGGVAIAPMSHIAGKQFDKHENDKEFNTGNFASMLAPAAGSAYIGAGVTSNIVASAKKAADGKMSTKQAIKNVVSPKNIHQGFKREVRAVKNTFSSSKSGKGRMGRLGKLGAGLFGASLLGADFVDPARYAYNTLSGKNKKKETPMVKTAGIFTKTMKAVKDRSAASKTLKMQGKSVVDRPDLVAGATADKAKATKDLKNEGKKFLGAGLVGAYGVHKVKKEYKRSIMEKKHGLGHRGAEYGNLIL